VLVVLNSLHMSRDPADLDGYMGRGVLAIMRFTARKRETPGEPTIGKDIEVGSVNQLGI